MLEPWFLSALVALLVSASAVFVSAWETRVRLRRVELQLLELEERQLREVKKRAATASVEARAGRLNPIDEALIARHTAHQGTIEDDSPWWAGLRKPSDG